MRNQFDGKLDYGFSNLQGCLSLSDEDLKTLKEDCYHAFSCRSVQSGNENYSSGSTYFARSDKPPRCFLEELALKIFRLHTKDVAFDEESSGAEWWTQVIDCRDDIGFHWDRDYGLEEDKGLHVHPHLATVTYLTDCGGPTIILNKIGTQLAKEDLAGVADELIVSRPLFGKHIKFDGRLLHAAPSDLFEEIDEDEEESSSDSSDSSGHSSSNSSSGSNSDGSNNSNSKSNTDSNPNGKEILLCGEIDDSKSNFSNSNSNSDSDESEKNEAYPKRITFLVNIWLNHIPIQSKAFPAQRLKDLKSPLILTSPSSCFNQLENQLGLGLGLGLRNQIETSRKKLIIEKDENAISITKECDEEKLRFGSINVPSITLKSLINSLQSKNKVQIEDETHQDKVWKFNNSGVKYQVTIPLPTAERFQSITQKFDAFRLLYNDSGFMMKINRIISNKRKAKLGNSEKIGTLKKSLLIESEK